MEWLEVNGHHTLYLMGLGAASALGRISFPNFLFYSILMSLTNFSEEKRARVSLLLEFLMLNLGICLGILS